MNKKQYEELVDAMHYIIANSFDVHIVEQNARKALDILNPIEESLLKEIKL